MSRSPEYLEWVRPRLPLEPLAQHQLEDVARLDVLFGDVHSGQELRLRREGGNVFWRDLACVSMPYACESTERGGGGEGDGLGYGRGDNIGFQCYLIAALEAPSGLKDKVGVLQALYAAST